MDLQGPKALLKAAKIDHIRTGGTRLNQKFTPQFLQSASDLVKPGHLIRAYFKMDGHHVQVISCCQIAPLPETTGILPVPL